jgi:multiple antibiotic resistance protein
MIFLTYLAFSLSDLIVKKVGENLIAIIGKLMGLILAIIGTGMVTEGIKLTFN